MTGKIDTHQHFLPQPYIEAVGLDMLASVMPNKRAPSWSEEAALAMMDDHGIARGILSISSGPPIPDAPTLLRCCNEEGVAIGARHPSRFGLFASLPLPDIDASLAELDYALGPLKADGVILFTNYAGRYLGDPQFRPLLEELNRRKAVAFIHPTEVPYHLIGQPPQSVIEFPFDTTRAAASLIFSGAMKTFPDIRFLLSHAGGTLPYLAQRLAGAVLFNPELVETIGEPQAMIRAFWYDLALSMSKAQLAALLEVADPARITFGTDFPMAPLPMIGAASRALATWVMPVGLGEALAFGNARALFGDA